MVSIGQNLTLQQAQLTVQKKTVQTEDNTTENNVVENQATTNASRAGNFLPVNQIHAGSLLANNGIKINKPAQPEEPEQPSIELMATFNIPNRYMLDQMLQGGVFQEGDTIRLKIGEKDGWIEYLNFTVNESGDLVSTGSGGCSSDFWE